MKVKVRRIKADSLEELLMKLAEATYDSFEESELECEEMDSSTVEKPSVNLEFFINGIAVKKGWKFEKTNGWLGSIAEISPIAAFNIVLREIAIFLDQKYEDHIENSEKIFAISPLDGRIHEICKAHIKNYRNFAAFRTIEDAKFACNILRDQLKGMFKKNAKRE